MCQFLCFFRNKWDYEKHKKYYNPRLLSEMLLYKQDNFHFQKNDNIIEYLHIREEVNILAFILDTNWRFVLSNELHLFCESFNEIVK